MGWVLVGEGGGDGVLALLCMGAEATMRRIHELAMAKGTDTWRGAEWSRQGWDRTG